MTQQNQSQASGTSTQLPEPQTKPLEGKVEEEKLGYASELLAYRVIDNLAGTIARRVRTQLGEGRSVLLVSDLEYALAGLPLVEIREQITLIRDAFAKREEEHRELLSQEPETPEASRRRTLGVDPVTALTTAFTLLGQAPKIMGTVADVAAFFRSNYKITGLDFQVADQALFSSVAGALVGRRMTPVIPGFYGAKDSALLSDLTHLSDRAAHLKKDRDALASLLPEPDKKEDAASSEGKEQLAKIAAAVRETDAVLQSYQGFRTSWTTLAEGQEGTKLEKALARERIEKSNATHLLWLKILSSGGEATVRDRLIGEDRVGFMGGAVVGFALASVEGEVLAADTLSQFGVNGFRIRDLVGGNEEVSYFPTYAHAGDRTDDS